MIDFEISSVSRHLVEAIFDERESVSYREIRTASLPSFVKIWFHLGVEAWYAPEYARRETQSHFNFNDEMVQVALKPFDLSLKDTAQFSRTDCLQVITGALQHELAYLRYPVDAVTSILFQQSEVIDGLHIVDFLSQFQREPYYTESIRGYVSHHEDTRLDQDLLEQFLSNAEREAYATRPLETLQTAVTSVTEMLGLVNGNGDPDQVSIDVWASFFQERQLYDILPQLSTIIDANRSQQREALSIEDLCASFTEEPVVERPVESEETPGIIIDVPLDEEGKEPERPVETPEDSVEPPYETPEDSAPAISFDFDMADPPVEIPPAGDEHSIASTFAPPVDEPEALPDPVASPEEPEILEEAVSGASVFDDDSVETSETNDEDPPPSPRMIDESMAITRSIIPPPAVDIPPAEISEKLERMFIKKLFNKDDETYRSVLAQLESAVSWEEAFSIIEEIWQERGLNLFSKESQEFTRVFYERYYPPT